MLAVNIENYEGPLDLLIHLVHKNEMDIFDVPISEITNHFVAEIRRMQELDMEIAAEFIHMASYLIYLKSRSLLPQDATADETYIEETFNLAQLLVELTYCKELAMVLKSYGETAGKYLCRRQSLLLPKEDDYQEDVFQLVDAFFNISAEKTEEKVVVHNMKEQSDAVVNQARKIILEKEETLWSELAGVFPERFEKAIAFSSVLMLSKDKLIRSIQESNFSDILMRRLRGASQVDNG